MISVKKDFDNPPPVLLTGKEDAWRDPSVMAELKRLYHGKCAYCETKTDDLVIDHFRPKSKYLWLANEWSNLLPACVECNNAKRDRFPITGQLVEASTKKEDCRANSKYLLSEKPLLVHPEVDTVENYFYASQEGYFNSLMRKGNETINVLTLNRDKLVSLRRAIFEKVYDRFKEKIFRTEDSNFYDNLMHLSLPQAEFANFGRYIVFDFQDLVLDYFDKNEMNTPSLDSSFSPKVLQEQIDYNKKIWDIAPINLGGPIPETTIQRIKIINYQEIKEVQLNIPQNTNWVFLTGENGFGKTTVLKAILSGLTGYTKNLPENTRIEISALCKQTGIAHLDAVKRNILSGNLLSHRIDPPLAAFGAIRTKFWKQSDELSLHSNLSGENEFVLDIENKLKVLHGVEGFSSLKNAIIQTMKSLIPNLADVRIVENESKNDTEIFYIEKDEQDRELSPVKFDDLALGMRGIIGLAGDIIIRLLGERIYADSNDNEKYKLVAEPVGSPRRHISSFNDLVGIVLIDEFDNHLHPKWQRRLVEKLSKLFPYVQFIVSTHSPIPLLGAPVDRTVILNVNRTKEEGITVERVDDKLELEELLPNTILTSPIFGFNDIVHKQAIRPESKVRTEDTFSELEKNNELNKKIKDFLTEAKEQELIERIKAKRNK